MSEQSCLSFGQPRRHQAPLTRFNHVIDKDEDARLVEELNAMTVKERQQLFEEIHGVDDVIEETAELVQSSVSVMKEHIKESIPKQDKKAFEMACHLKPSMQSDDQLFLMWLRATRFDAKAAAQKICNHFSHKLELFGEGKLPKRITLEDFDEDGLKPFYAANHAWLPMKDRSGRPVSLNTVSRCLHKDWKADVRYQWYQMMTIAEEDEEAQKKGAVGIVSYYGQMKDSFSDMAYFMQNFTRFQDDWPLRTCAIHAMFDNPILKHTLFEPLIKAFSRQTKMRVRLHTGSPLEIEYELLGFGISAGESVIPGQGVMSRSSVDSFLASRRIVDHAIRDQVREQETVTGTIQHPTSGDILMGHSFRHTLGNVAFLRDIASIYGTQYAQIADKHEKTIYSMFVVQDLGKRGRRFLSQCEGGWQVVAPAIARNKVSQALRHAVRSEKNKAQHDSNGRRASSDFLLESKAGQDQLLHVQQPVQHDWNHGTTSTQSNQLESHTRSFGNLSQTDPQSKRTRYS